MSVKFFAGLFAISLLSLLAGCNPDKPVVQPPSVTKPINKAKDTAREAQQKMGQQEQMDPSKQLEEQSSPSPSPSP